GFSLLLRSPLLFGVLDSEYCDVSWIFEFLPEHPSKAASEASLSGFFEVCSFSLPTVFRTADVVGVRLSSAGPLMVSILGNVVVYVSHGWRQLVSTKYVTGTPNKRGDLRRRLNPRRSRNTSRRPEPINVFSRIRRDRSASHRRRQGDKRRSYQGSRPRRTEPLLESEDSKGGHWTSNSRKQKSSIEEEDLSQPWTCKEADPFTPRISYFELLKKSRMPNNVKTYDGSDDLEDHLKIFQAATKVERWAMPTWCHMFNSTLTESARVWFDDLPPEFIDIYDDLKKACLANYLQQKKCIKDSVEIHHIKQREGESTKDFVQRFKAESRHVKGAP
nr:reverse transcriptase domain-containing protein [Tanacetum cinerariifolium]